jgi:hypothetical protein
MDSGLRCLKQAKVVSFFLIKRCANHLFTFAPNNDLAFEGMRLFLAGIVPSLFFLGRSMGDSDTSIKTVSYNKEASILVVLYK